MKKKIVWSILSCLMVLSLLLGACTLPAIPSALEPEQTIPPGTPVRYDVVAEAHIRTILSLESRQIALKEAVTALNAWEPDFVIQLGDLIEGRESQAVTEQEFTIALEIYNELNVPKYHVMGNHDYSYIDYVNSYIAIKLWMETMGIPSSYYSFNVREFHFVVLNNAGWNVVGEQLNWLQEDLSSSNMTTIVFAHRPILPYEGMPADFGNPELQAVLEANRAVIAVIHGHLHENIQARINGIDYYAFENLHHLKDDPSYAEVYIYPDSTIIIKGFGNQVSYDSRLPGGAK